MRGETRGETRVKGGESSRSERGQSSLVSPRFHPRGVKREMGHIYRKNNNFSLSSPHDSPFHPHPRARVDFRVRTCARGVKRRMVKRGPGGAAFGASILARVARGAAGLAVATPSAPAAQGPTSAARARAGALWVTGQSARGGDGSFPAIGRRRGPREQHPLETDFLSVVRSGPAEGRIAHGPRRWPVSRPGPAWPSLPPRRPFATRANVAQRGRSRLASPPGARSGGPAERIRTTFPPFARRQTP